MGPTRVSPLRQYFVSCGSEIDGLTITLTYGRVLLGRRARFNGRLDGLKA